MQKLRKWVEPPGYQIQACDDKGFFNFGHLKILSGADYYQLLQVPRNATPEQIKKQYYLLARKWHPDKNVGDPLANARFQQLGEAYQVNATTLLAAQWGGCSFWKQGRGCIADSSWPWECPLAVSV